MSIIQSEKIMVNREFEIYWKPKILTLMLILQWANGHFCTLEGNYQSQGGKIFHDFCKEMLPAQKDGMIYLACLP